MLTHPTLNKLAGPRKPWQEALMTHPQRPTVTRPGLGDDVVQSRRPGTHPAAAWQRMVADGCSSQDA